MAKVCQDAENYPVTQLIIDDEFGPIGPGGMRALMTALMGTGTVAVLHSYDSLHKLNNFF